MTSDCLALLIILCTENYGIFKVENSFLKINEPLPFFLLNSLILFLFFSNFFGNGSVQTLQVKDMLPPI